MQKLLALFLLIISFSLYSSKVAVCIVATGKYIQLADAFIKSARPFFLPNHSVTYVLFSDSELVGEDIIWIYEKKEPWPFATLMRLKMYAKQKELLSHFDYLFAIDADMLCVDYVGDEILSERVATSHPAYTFPRNGPGPEFDSNKDSCAYIPKEEQVIPYFAGAFFGGTAAEFLQTVQVCSEMIDLNLSKGIIAQYHDETHLNWYFRKYKPTKILSPSYCYPDDFFAKRWALHKKFRKKILCLEKPHALYR
jgi:hypothetical protein